MSYNNYRISINNTMLSDKWIAKGTFSASREKRVCDSYTDANGKLHESYYPDDKTIISFNIRERNESEQNTIKWLWSSTENLSVTYWDDLSCAYKTGTFRMKRPQFNHMTINGSLGLMYTATTIALEEY